MKHKTSRRSDRIKNHFDLLVSEDGPITKAKRDFKNSQLTQAVGTVVLRTENWQTGSKAINVLWSHPEITFLNVWAKLSEQCSPEAQLITVTAGLN